MLRGSHSINLDAKGRISIPTRYRQGIQDSCERQLIITLAVNEHVRGIKGCIWFYPLPEWERLEKKIDSLPSSSKPAIRFQRFVQGNAIDCEMDKQGRVSIPERIRSLSGLESSVVLTGLGKKFEVWNEDIWNQKFDDFMEPDQEADDDEETIDLAF